MKGKKFRTSKKIRIAQNCQKNLNVSKIVRKKIKCQRITKKHSKRRENCQIFFKCLNITNKKKTKRVRNSDKSKKGQKIKERKEEKLKFKKSAKKKINMS